MKIIFILLCCLVCVPAFANIFKCIDGNGKVSYSDSPCAGNPKNIDAHGNADAPVGFAGKDAGQTTQRDDGERAGKIAIPKLSGRITDLTDTLTNQQVNALESKLADFEARNGNLIAVLVLPTTQSEDIAAFSLRVAKAWKTSMLLVVAKNDRNLRLEVGRDLTGVVTDAIAKRILAETIKPHFKSNDYAGGIEAGIADLMGLIETVRKPAATNQTADGQVAVPDLERRVTDLTHTLTNQQVNALESKLANFEAKNGSQIAVLMLPSTQSEDIATFSLRVAKAWKIGWETINDGILLVVAKNDRNLRLEVGRGLEGVVTDAIAKRILTETIKPHFKTNDYVGGIDAGITAVMGLIVGNVDASGSSNRINVVYTPESHRESESFFETASWLYLVVALLLFKSIGLDSRYRNHFRGSSGSSNNDDSDRSWHGGGGDFRGSGASDSWGSDDSSSSSDSDSSSSSDSDSRGSGASDSW